MPELLEPRQQRRHPNLTLHCGAHLVELDQVFGGSHSTGNRFVASDTTPSAHSDGPEDPGIDKSEDRHPRPQPEP
jgi:hypothetical protein